jgi:hypothetical protein
VPPLLFSKIELLPKISKLSRHTVRLWEIWLFAPITPKIRRPQAPHGPEVGDKTRVLELIPKLQELHVSLDSAPPAWQQIGLERWDALTGKLNQLSNDINERTRRYRGQLTFLPDLRSGAVRDGFGWLPHSATLHEGQALEDLIQLARTGNLDRLALCAQCRQRWVFRSRKNRRYCSDKCCQEEYEKSPERKEQKRKYQIDYYREHTQKFLAGVHRRKKKP